MLHTQYARDYHHAKRYVYGYCWDLPEILYASSVAYPIVQTELYSLTEPKQLLRIYNIRFQKRFVYRFVAQDQSADSRMCLRAVQTVNIDLSTK